MSTHQTHTDLFQHRHIGPSATDQEEMLANIGVDSLQTLINETIPPDIQLSQPLAVNPPEPEHVFLARLRETAAKNKPFKSYIGQGYYGAVTPSVILRNVLENPGWYTPYTPYQAEIAQGRLEGLLNFQTMVAELTGMDTANASLLDEATAAAEAMTMMHRLQRKKSREGHERFFVAETCFPQTKEVVLGRAEPLGIDVVFGTLDEVDLSDGFFGALVQTPDAKGVIHDLSAFIERAHDAGVLVGVASDLMALVLCTSPGEQGADIVFGNAQRFGVPMGYGGPHAAFFAFRDKQVREVPGRIIGVSLDRLGKPAYRMALQTREQHIRREKAKSNICTAQALLANMAGMYAVYHGPEGLKNIAGRIHFLTARLAAAIGADPTDFFDTIRVRLDDSAVEALRAAAVDAGYNFFYPEPGIVQISLDETTTEEDLAAVAALFGKQVSDATAGGIPNSMQREGDLLSHEVFHRHRSETEMMRYLKRLERKDIGLDTSMIPLGSCTMKLNAASEMIPVTWPEFCTLHPFAPVEQAEGFREVFDQLESALCAVTGLHAVSLQPNSGAQGEYAGLLVIRAYLQDQGQTDRDVVLIPSSAHGTNPASAALVGMKVVVVKCDERAYIDMDDLRAKVEQHRDALAALMVTYPSTHGIFEENIREVCALIHDNGGQVYMDGANLNAQVGLTNVAICGADVCHINLHKTFSIPHGGGGPGMGPIAVAEHLAPFLPGHPLVDLGRPKAIRPVSAAPWGSADILLISLAYIRMLGGEGMADATRCAILNANYIKARLENHYRVHCTGAQGRVAHELIFDVGDFKDAGVNEADIAKRLMDYGFHAPTVSWPIAHTFMVEPTESESKEELDRFCDALISIHAEIKEIVDGQADPKDNVLVNAPHTADEATADQWPHAYTREKAVFPLPFVRENKVWPAVARIDNSYGDRNLVCTCPPLDAYTDD